MAFPILHVAAVLLAVAASLVAAKTFPDTTTCDASCQQLVLNATSWITEQLADPTLGFYDVPSNFSRNLAPGTVLKTEVATDLTGYVVPSGLTMSRIIYTTEDIDGTVIPASAYVLWPYSAFPAGPEHGKGGMPMVAWAHGTSGTFRPCSPSNYRALQYHFQVPFALALQGIAVVAPDYAGLGVSRLPSGETIPHRWLTAPSHAEDLANAVTAARSAFPDMLDPRGPFVAMGHSQGGGAAWSFAERQARKPLEGYKGTVSIAPVTRIIDDLSFFVENSIPAPIVTAQAAVIDSISQTYPEYNYTGLTPTGYDRWHNVLARVEGCFPVLGLVYSDVDATDVARPGWYRDPIVGEWAGRVEAGRKPFAGPLLVLSGETDHIVRHEGIQAAVDDTCSLIERQGRAESLEHATFARMDHFPVIQASQMKWMGWIKDRLVGNGVASKGCSSEVVTGLRTECTPQSPAPNFFLSFFGPEEGWKYSL